MIKVDQKYTAIVTKANGEIVTDYIIFRAKDQAVPGMLRAYIRECRTLGCAEFHMDEMEKVRDRVIEYQRLYGKKVPDTNEDDLLRFLY